MSYSVKQVYSVSTKSLNPLRVAVFNETGPYGALINSLCENTNKGQPRPRPSALRHLATAFLVGDSTVAMPKKGREGWVFEFYDTGVRERREVQVYTLTRNNFVSSLRNCVRMTLIFRKYRCIDLCTVHGP